LTPEQAPPNAPTQTPSVPSWLLITVTTAGGAASLRVHVWRKLRGLGAVYLQQSACLLPDRPEVARQVRRMLDRVSHDGGNGRLLHIDLSDPAERDQLIAEFQSARDAEYDEVLQRLPGFFAELEHETARGRATYAEVEENEADLNRFRFWIAKIADRDYFGAPRGEAARAELARAEETFAAFETAALAAEETPAPPDNAKAPHRRTATDTDGSR
jgi:hypothetical protein